jgi:hypothetical protein
MKLCIFPRTTVRPEPVEGLFFSYPHRNEGRGFDRLSPNGVGI